MGKNKNTNRFRRTRAQRETAMTIVECGPGARWTHQLLVRCSTLMQHVYHNTPRQLPQLPCFQRRETPGTEGLLSMGQRDSCRVPQNLDWGTLMQTYCPQIFKKILLGIHQNVISSEKKTGDGLGELDRHLTHCGWAEAYLCTKGHLDPSSRFAIATIDMGRKVQAVSFLGGAGSPSNTMSPGPRSIPPYQLVS